MSKKAAETATAPFADLAVVEEAEVIYDPNPLTETVMHRVLMWGDPVGFDEAVNDRAKRIHEGGGQIAKREFCHVTVGNTEVVLICHLTYHVPVAEEDDAE